MHRCLLDLGDVDVNAEYGYSNSNTVTGLTVLWRAVQPDVPMDMFRMLVDDRRIDLNARCSRNKETALHRCVVGPHAHLSITAASADDRVKPMTAVQRNVELLVACMHAW